MNATLGALSDPTVVWAVPKERLFPMLGDLIEGLYVVRLVDRVACEVTACEPHQFPRGGDTDRVYSVEVADGWRAGVARRKERAK